MGDDLSVRLYDVYLDFDELVYRGREKIELSTPGDVALDCEGIKILGVRVGGRDAEWRLEGDLLHVACGSFDGQLEVDFEGRVPEDSLTGIYAAPYEYGRVITTQFEAIYARRFIPCFDTPRYKSRFRLRVSVREGLKAISNMPLEAVEPSHSTGKVTYRFQTTPPMPTYLLYLGIGEFLEKEDRGGDKPIILAHLRGRDDKVDFPLAVGRRALEFFEDYFGISYLLPKLHFVAIPGSSAGGMENWGAITFGEVYLLASDRSPAEHRMDVVDIVAHEVAHQWFGDLVTMKWWDDLWLNESFATIMAYKATEKLYPEWDAQALFVAGQMNDGLFADSLTTSHPIEAKVSEAHEIEGMFDSISYSKGASVLRMLEGYIGEEAFRRGVKSYLQNHAYSSATGSDFWGALAAASEKDVGQIAEEWIKNEGYPLIELEADGRRLKLTQTRFTLAGGAQPKRYTVPLTLEVNGKPTTVVLRDQEKVLTLEEEIASLKANLNRTGFYRVHFTTLEKLAPLNNLESGALLDDYFNLYLAGRISFDEYRSALKVALSKEEHSLPAWVASSQLWLLYTLKPDKYAQMARDIHLQLLQSWQKAGGDVAELTVNILAPRLALLDQGYALALASLYPHYDHVPHHLREAVLYAHANVEGDFDGLLEKYRGTVDPEEKVRFLGSLAAIRGEDAFSRLLGLLGRGEVRLSDGYLLFRASASNPWQRRALVGALLEDYGLFERFAERVTGHAWAAARVLVEPLAREGATDAGRVGRVLERMERRETEREVKEIRELIQAYSRV